MCAPMSVKMGCNTLARATVDGKNFAPERGAKLFPSTVQRLWPLGPLGANVQRLASQLAPLPGQGLRLPAGSRSLGLGGGLR